MKSDWSRELKQLKPKRNWLDPESRVYHAEDGDGIHNIGTTIILILLAAICIPGFLLFMALDPQNTGYAGAIGTRLFQLGFKYPVATIATTTGICVILIGYGVWDLLVQWRRSHNPCHPRR